VRRGFTGAVALAASIAFLTSCTGSTAETAFRPSYREVPCPEDLDFVLVQRHTCAHLTVLEDRSKPDGRTIQLFVVHVVPQSGTASNPDPIYVPGTKLAGVQKFFDMAPIADRTDREEFIMDQRGVGRSEPSLACPEVDRVNAVTVAAPTGDPSARTAFVDAVMACFQRITSQGIDPGAYDLQAMAADGEDLRRALGIDEWGIISIGSASRIALEMARAYPEHLRELVLDSPEVPQVDPFTEGILGTRAALGQMAAACRADAACSRRFPDLEQAFEAASTALDEQPLSLRSQADGAGESVDVHLDGSMFLRGIRTLLAGEGDVVEGATPAVVYAALDGNTSLVRQYLTDDLVSQQAYCLGYGVVCDPTNTISVGAYLSVLCSDIAPFIDRSALTTLAGADDTFSSVFAQSPWFDACDAWKVPPSDTGVASPVITDVPTLLLLGRFDPFGSPAVVRPATTGLSQSWVVIDPAAGRNTLADACFQDLRTLWLADPTSPPDVSCVKQMTPLPFLIPRSV
jgi:pimeloyl-ACP methyl ester carboxylesterase